jgi:hypothetical protein
MMKPANWVWLRWGLRRVPVWARVLVPVVLAAAPTAVAAEPAAGNKGAYSLFDPTPRELLRELSPDRPDATESPVTVDAGHFAVEASLFDWSRDGGDEAFSVMATNLKVGVTPDVDFQVVFDAYTWEDLESGDGAEGFGDVTLRAKCNLWGNDGGRTALALLPFVKVPTGTELSNGEMEGGLAVPFAVELTGRAGLGLMAVFAGEYDDEGGGHGFVFLHSAVVGLALTDRLGVFNEFVGLARESRYEPYYSGGFTFAVSDDLLLDCGTQIGLDGDARDIAVFAGFSRRF